MGPIPKSVAISTIIAYASIFGPGIVHSQQSEGLSRTIDQVIPGDFY